MSEYTPFGEFVWNLGRICRLQPSAGIYQSRYGVNRTTVSRYFTKISMAKTESETKNALRQIILECGLQIPKVEEFKDKRNLTADALAAMRIEAAAYCYEIAKFSNVMEELNKDLRPYISAGRLILNSGELNSELVAKIINAAFDCYPGREEEGDIHRRAPEIRQHIVDVLGKRFKFDDNHGRTEYITPDLSILEKKPEKNKEAPVSRDRRPESFFAKEKGGDETHEKTIKYLPFLLTDIPASSDTGFVIVADCGMGKTSLLQAIGRLGLQRPKVIPVLINAPDLVEYASNDLWNLIRSQYEDLSISKSDLASYEIWYLIDQIDWIVEQKDMNTLMDRLGPKGSLFSSSIGQSRRVFGAVRPTVYSEFADTIKTSYRCVHISPFQDHQIISYLGELAKTDTFNSLKRNAGDLLTIPLLLSFTKELLGDPQKEDDLRTVTTRSSLYDRFIEYLFERDKPRGHEIHDKGIILNYLQEISFMSLQQNMIQYCTTASIIKCVGPDGYSKLKRWTAVHSIEKRILESGMTQGARLYFTHQSFQEYFASLELAERLARSGGGETASQIIAECLEYAHWDEVWRFVHDRLPDVHQASEALESNPLQKALDTGTDILVSTMQKAPLITAELMRVAYPYKAITILAKLLEINNTAKDDWNVRLIIAQALGKIKDPAVVSKLIQLLRDGDRVVRMEAIRVQGEMKDAAAVPELIRLLRDKDWYVCGAAIRALGEMKDAAVVPELIQLVRDEDWEVRWAALRALGAIKDPAAVPELIWLLRDKNSGVRSDAARALGAIKDPAAVPGLIRLLRDEDWGVRSDAARALGKIRDPVAVLELIQLLRDEDADVREAAIRALGEIGDRAAVPELIQLLWDEDEDEDVRRTAARTLGKIKDANVFTAIIPLLHDENWYVRQAATDVLGELRDPAAVPEIIQLFGDEDWDVRQAAVEALVTIIEPVVIPEVVQLLRDAEGHVREAAVGVLAEIRDPVMVPELIRMLWDEDGVVRQAAVYALGEIKDMTAVPDLIRLLRDEDAYVREAIAEALGKISDQLAVPELIRLLRDEKDQVRLKAARLLGEIKDLAAVAELMSLLRDEDSNVRGMTAWALGKIGDLAAVPELIGLLRDEDGEVRQAAARALGKIKDPAAVPELIRLLQDVDSNMRQAAIQTLGEIRDRAAVPELIKSLGIEEGQVRQAAIQALATIDPSMSLYHISNRISDTTTEHGESIKYQEAAVEIMRQSPRRYLGILMGNEGD